MFHGDGGTPVYAEHQFAVLDDNLALAPLGQFLVDRDLIVVFMQAPAPPISVIAAGTRFPVGEDPVSAPIRTWSGAKDSYEGVPETNLADNRAYFVDVFDKQLKNLYAIDEDRVLLAGFSGGGEFASALLNPFLGYRFRGGSISLCGSVDPTNAEVVVPAPPDTPITDDIRSHYKMYFAINSGDDLIVPTRLAVDYFSAPGRFTPEQLRFDEFAPIVPQHCAFDDAATPEEETGLTFLVRGIEFVDPRR
jgi:hypothetical protein